MQNMILVMAAQEILKATGVDFTGQLTILAYRLKNKTINALIAEIKEQD